MVAMRKRRIKFALELKDDEQVRSLEELQEHFDLEKIIGYYQDGKLLTWLEDRFYDDEADEIKKLSGDESDLGEQLCRIFNIEHSDVQDADDPETIAWRKERLERLKQFTDDSSILQHVDWVAFDQDDLEEILHEENCDTVYLCHSKFVFPSGILRKKNMRYIGIGKNVEAVIKSNEPVDFDGLGIVFENVIFDEKYEKIVSECLREEHEDANHEEKISEDSEKGLSYYIQAAESGDSDAMYKLGCIYKLGIGTIKDFVKARKWFKDAALAGNKVAMGELNAMGVSLDNNNSSNSTYAESSVVITNRQGMHARPASVFCQMAQEFCSKVMIKAKGKIIDAKSILMIMSMGLTKGTRINIIADGIDAEEAVSTLTGLVESQFGEWEEDEVFPKVCDIIVEQLGVEYDEIAWESYYMDDLGADSLDLVELVMAFEETFNIEITDEAASVKPRSYL